uniref:uncharacterized protein isoform X3 n=1 Tax=Myxine glutinosa TaxID=7769 RepID=UPI00358E49A9
MKQKLNQTRTYDEDGYRRRAACVCLSGGRENEVLLVSSSQHPEHWIIPGGGMEPGEEPKVAAVREVYEETEQTKTDSHGELQSGLAGRRWVAGGGGRHGAGWSLIPHGTSGWTSTAADATDPVVLECRVHWADCLVSLRIKIGSIVHTCSF